jgi:unsaturated chondroitin disaccharide hydrolase
MRTIETIYQSILEKMESEVKRTGSKIPYIADKKTGSYDDMTETDICWWTNGFWPGILWQLYNATGSDIYRTCAVQVENRLDAAFNDFLGLHHDVGFMWLPSAVADYRLTGNKASLKRGLHAATLLAGRYNPRGKFIRCWNDEKIGWIIVDSMLNINILYWASDQTGDPRFRFIAEDHADTVIKKIIRPDGSCSHIAILNPENGDVLDTPAGQGYASGSLWTRGQSWAIYGFALSYTHTRKEEYLYTARKAADTFIKEEEKYDYKTPVDFRQPAIPVRYDSTAGCCAACGLLEIADILGDIEGKTYRNAAERLIHVTDELFCNWNRERDGIVDYGTAAYHSKTANHVPIIYGDYYFIEAVFRLAGKNLRIW